MTGQSDIDDAILDEALSWRARLERDDADWDAYTRWLEADPRHRHAFNSIELVAAAVDDHRDPLRAVLRAPQPALRARNHVARRAAYIGAGLAATFALFLSVPSVWRPEAVQSYQADGAGARQIALAGGIGVTLSRSSRIIVHGKDAHRIELAAGEAYFDVRHDPSRALTISAGRYSITDIGTRFSVNRAGDAFRVAVSEGMIDVSSARSGRNVHVTAGHQLLAEGGEMTLAAMASAQVGSWQQGRLSYSNAPLALVIADIERYSGRPVLVDPSLENAHFSGELVIGDGSKLLSDLAAVMGAEVRRKQGVDRIGAARR